MADGLFGLHIIDISDPANPFWIDGYDTPGFAKNVFLSGQYAYIADEYSLMILHLRTIGVEEGNNIPQRFALLQNYPNPFNAQTTIKYGIPTSSDVLLEIYDITGRKLETLLSEYQEAGEHQIIWNAGDRPSGIYFYKLKAGEISKTDRCILIK